MRYPDIKGSTCAAWNLKIPNNPAEKAWTACLESWILNGPGYHPAWAWWQVSVVHLRDIPGVRPSAKHYAEAEYEFMIIAFNPQRGNPDLEAIDDGREWGDMRKPKFLFPHDVCKQFHGVNDEQAAQICAAAVSAIVNGYLSPDRDFREAWNHAIDDTVKHMADGKHEGARIL